MKRLAWITCFTGLLCAGLISCGDAGPLIAPEIHLGQDVCCLCGMAVSDGRYAAAVVVRKDGRDEVFLFDDLGELPRWSLPTHDRIAWFVRDADTQTWLDAEHATFVKSREIRTPMGRGVAAYATPERAETVRAEVSGETATFADLRPEASAPTP